MVFRSISIAVLAVILSLSVSACFKSGPTEDELVKIKELKLELEATQKELSGAKDSLKSFSGGLLGVLTKARIEVLKTNNALIKQRIHVLESGAELVFQVKVTSPDPEAANEIEREIEEQKDELEGLRKEAENAKGLLGLLKLTAVATQNQSLALLRQKYLIAKYGLYSPALEKTKESKSAKATENMTTDYQPDAQSDSKAPERQFEKEIVKLSLYGKEFKEQELREYIFFNFGVMGDGLDKPTRAIKGILVLSDLFGEAKFKLKWTINEPLTPGVEQFIKGVGFKYNQFKDDHNWVRTEDLKDIKASYIVRSIIYQDGSKMEF